MSSDLGKDLINDGILGNHYRCHEGVYEIVSTSNLYSSHEPRFEALLQKPSGETSRVSFPVATQLGDERVYTNGEEQPIPRKCIMPNGEARWEDNPGNISDGFL